MNGLNSLSIVFTQNEGWTINKLFKFLRNLKLMIQYIYTYSVKCASSECVCVPSINHSVEAMKPLYTRHAVPRGSTVQVHYHIIINDQLLNDW